jgi:hypothetical protein
MLVKIVTDKPEIRRCVWHPQGSFFAFSVGPDVVVVELPTLLKWLDGKDGTVTLDDLVRGKSSGCCLFDSMTGPSPVTAICFGEDDIIVSGATDGFVSLFDYQTGFHVHSFCATATRDPNIAAPVHNLVYTKQGVVVLTDANLRLIAWNCVDAHHYIHARELRLETNTEEVLPFAAVSWDSQSQSLLVWPSSSDVGYIVSVGHQLSMTGKMALPRKYATSGKCVLSASDNNGSGSKSIVITTGRDVLTLTLPQVDGLASLEVPDETVIPATTNLVNAFVDSTPDVCADLLQEAMEAASAQVIHDLALEQPAPPPLPCVSKEAVEPTNNESTHEHQRIERAEKTVSLPVAADEERLGLIIEQAVEKKCKSPSIHGFPFDTCCISH